MKWSLFRARTRWFYVGYGVLVLVSVSWLVLVLRWSSDGPAKHRVGRKLKSAGRVFSEDEDRNVTVLPSVEEIERLSFEDAAALYHKYINTVQILCRKIMRIGKLDDGGWDVCEDVMYRPRPPCLVYSFGVGEDFSFDDHVAERYHCDVHSFDPSMIHTADQKRGETSWFHQVGLAEGSKKLQNGWTVKTLQDIRKDLKHTQRKIDLLKIDVEEWEWRALPQMIASGAVSDIPMILVELHVSIATPPVRFKYVLGLRALKAMYDAGYRIYFTHRNLWCTFLSEFQHIDNIGCHEVYFIKVT